MAKGSKKDRLIGQEIDGYRILDVLGRGGMGVVYKAEHVVLGRIEALKIISSHFAEDEAFIRRFQLEARALGQIHHPNIVVIHALRPVREGLYIAMEYVEGKTLADWLRHGAYPWQNALPVMKQLLAALISAHAHGIIHRDIKPRNIMLTPQGVVKVMDFGLAKIMENQGDTTMTMVQAGTPCYMSPEQVLSLDGTYVVDHRTDLFSLGMTFYEMLAGQLPFERERSHFTIFKAIVDGQFPSPITFAPSIPKGLAKIIMQALETDPNDRYQSAQQILTDLQLFEKDEFRPLVGGEFPVSAAPVAAVEMDDTVAPVPELALMETQELERFAEAEALTIAELTPVEELKPEPPPRPPRPPRLRVAQAAARAKAEQAGAALLAGGKRIKEILGAGLGWLSAVIMAGLQALGAVPDALKAGFKWLGLALQPYGARLRTAPAAVGRGLGRMKDAALMHQKKLLNAVLAVGAVVFLVALVLLVPTLTSNDSVGSEAGSTMATTTAGPAEEPRAPETAALAGQDTEQQNPEALPLDEANLDETPDEDPPEDVEEEEDPTTQAGILQIDSSPQGAQIFIDGQLSGTTPRTIQEVPLGQHTITLSLDGHEAHTEAVAVEAAQRQAVSATLAPLTGTVAIGVNPWGQLYVDGELKLNEVSFRQTLTLPAGSHTVTVVNPTEGRWQRTVTIVPGEEHPLLMIDFKQKVKVTVAAQDNEGRPMDRGEIFVDGKPMGPVPREILVPVGLRKIEVRAEGYVLDGAPKVKNFEHDETEPLTIRLRPADQADQ